MRRDPRGDLAGRHRRGEKAVWRLKYTGLYYERVRPFDIMVCASRSFVGAGIRTFSMVDGRPAVWSHCGQVIVRDGKLVISEANYPRHAYTPVEDYLRADAAGDVRCCFLRIRESVWDCNLPGLVQARRECLHYHNVECEGRKYTAGIFLPMAGWSMVRNLTPFFRGRYESIPDEEWEKIFVCSHIIDMGWVFGQAVTGWDWWPSSLHKFVASPEDIFASKALFFVQGWIPEKIPLKEASNDGIARTISAG